MNIVLFSPEEIHHPLNRNDTRAAHILDILHKQPGDTFDAGILNGTAGTARITGITGTGIKFVYTPKTDGSPLYPLRMIIGFPRPIQLKRLLRDIASLGAGEVHLTGTELGEKSYLQSSMAEYGNAYRMLTDGSIQAKSTHVPELFLHRNLSACLEAITSSAFFSRHPVLAALDNVQPEMSLTAFLDKTTEVTATGQMSAQTAGSTRDRQPAQRNSTYTVPDSTDTSGTCLADGDALHHTSIRLQQRGVIAAIGSERGWTDRERKQLSDAGFTRCGMGSRILRTETAATAAATLILSKMEVL